MNPERKLVPSELLADVLGLIDMRKGDAYGRSCCVYCDHEQAHHDAAADSDDPWLLACSCPCHPARRALGDVDDGAQAP